MGMSACCCPSAFFSAVTLLLTSHLTPAPLFLPAAEAARANARVAELEREMAALRAEAGQREEEAARKRTEVETVTVPAVPEGEVAAKAQVGVGA